MSRIALLLATAALSALAACTPALDRPAVTEVRSAAIPAPRVYQGRLSPDLVEVDADTQLRLTAATREDLRRLPRRPRKGEHAFVGTLERGGRQVTVVLVESRGGASVYLNVASDPARFAASDRYVFHGMPPLRSVPYAAGDQGVVLWVPVAPGGFVERIPLHIVRSPSREAALSRGRDERVLFVGRWSAATRLSIDGRATKVDYDVDPGTGRLREDRFRIDAADIRLSPTRLDPATGRFLVEER